MTAHHAPGRQAEALAAEFLQREGLRVLERNWSCRAGELDIVARSASLLVVAEVRLRTHRGFGGAAASISMAKRRRILRATRLLLRRRPELASLPVRFDVLTMVAEAGPIEWIRGAFEALA